jgi:hypothetical protein
MIKFVLHILHDFTSGLQRYSLSYFFLTVLICTVTLFILFGFLLYLRLSPSVAVESLILVGRVLESSNSIPAPIDVILD